MLQQIFSSDLTVKFLQLSIKLGKKEVKKLKTTLKILKHNIVDKDWYYCYWMGNPRDDNDELVLQPVPWNEDGCKLASGWKRSNILPDLFRSSCGTLNTLSLLILKINKHFTNHFLCNAYVEAKIMNAAHTYCHKWID